MRILLSNDDGYFAPGLVAVAEAMRDDVKTPLYYAAGGGLTDLASAWLMEPRIAERLTLVWIGGLEYLDLAPPVPGVTGTEYNLNIDITSGQVVFNDSAIPIWQVPRGARSTPNCSRCSARASWTACSVAPA